MRLYAKPDFLIIGAQKAGTSSLYSWLTGHPDVLPARAKELHYFDRRCQGEPIADYWANFPLRARVFFLRRWRRRRVVTGEATPIYLFDPRVPAMVAEHLPDIRLIVILRDPVERAVSHYWMEFNRGAETLSLEEALDAEPDRLEAEVRRFGRNTPLGPAHRTASYVARGHYADQIGRWLDHFSRDQILYLEFDDLVSDPLAVYRRSLRFLGVDPDAAPPSALTRQRVGSKDETDPATLERLRQEFAGEDDRLRRLFDGDVSGGVHR